ncbi:Cas1p-domain-containing protein [Glonium stellatum]|uniref:Cas1p-domain-containing protein n=1 Tax=Glonium stellatum TaxID=574774 RepID=A0A8E2EMP2_9PEZI|nr:Cas1p-domain-containing protein [Glonium stellatum]
MLRLRFSAVAPSAPLVNRCAYILILLLFAAVAYRHTFLDAADPYKCGALLRDGQWLDSPELEPSRRPFQNWQPPGCMLHEYKGPEIAICAGSGKMLFVGDSTIRQVFWATAKKIDRDSAEKERATIDQHGDITFSRGGSTLKFIWDPFLNTSTLYDELRVYRESADSASVEKPPAGSGSGTGSGTGAGSGVSAENKKSVAMLIGGGLWHARHIQLDSLKHFKDTINNIATAAYPLDSTTSGKSLPLYRDDGIKDQIFFAPIQEPLYDELSPARAVTIVPEKIDQMNEVLENLPPYHGLKVLWSYSNMTLGQPEAYGESGLHVVENVAARMADVLLNLRCNAKSARRDRYFYDRTCCNDYKPLNWVQIAVLVITFAVLLVVAFRATRGTPVITPARVRFAKSIARQRSQSISKSSIESVLAAFAVIFCCICYCYLADRTQIFNKVQKQYTNFDFAVFLSISLMLGMLSIRGPPTHTGRRRSESYPGTSFQQSFLSRSQTNEWKGWMQCFILAYHYAGASNQLWINEIYQILMASYLLLTGYGHTMYFYQKKDYSFRRVAAVLIRLNLLACILPYMMQTTYTSYYFAPLASFWFLVIYFTMRIGCRRNQSLRFLVGKIIISAVIATAFIHIKGVLSAVFLILRFTCGVNWNVNEWEYRLGLDKYIVYVGMLVAVLYIRISAVISSPQIRPNLATEMLCSYFGTIRAFFTLAALVTFPVFWYATRCFPNIHDYNTWQPYIAWLPIVSFVVLRNSTKSLRNYHATLFAWLGCYSLEIYTLQYHILLAGDTRGLLSTGIFKGDGTIKNDRWRDLIALTPIFIWMSWRVGKATRTITDWITQESVANGQMLESTEMHGGKANELRLPDYNNGIVGQRTTSAAAAAPAQKKLRFVMWLKDVRIRLFILLAILWFLNITYT